jgi:hypothetical protein
MINYKTVMSCPVNQVTRANWTMILCDLMYRILPFSKKREQILSNDQILVSMSQKFGEKIHMVFLSDESILLVDNEAMPVTCSRYKLQRLGSLGGMLPTLIYYKEPIDFIASRRCH